MANLLLGMSIVALATLVGSSGALFFKLTSSKIEKNLFKLLKVPSLYLGFLFYGLSALLFVYGLRYGDLSALYPVAGLSYVWVSLLSVKFLNEKMNGYKWLGVCLILLGVIFIGLGA